MEQDVTDYPDGTGKSIKKSGAAKEVSDLSVMIHTDSQHNKG